MLVAGGGGGGGGGDDADADDDDDDDVVVDDDDDDEFLAPLAWKLCCWATINRMRDQTTRKSIIRLSSVWFSLPTQ